MNATVHSEALIGATPATMQGVPQRAPRPAAGPQDWEQLVSPGHVWAERVKVVSRRVVLPAFVLFFAGLVSLAGFFSGAGFSLLPLPKLSVPAFVVDALRYDPARYTDLGGGVRTDYRLAWMTDVPRSSGLSPEAWADLVKAVQDDLRAYGAGTDKWTATPALATAPKVTRPAKALTEHAARLGTGIVAIPEQAGPQHPVQVLAMVGGQWAWAVLSPYGCSAPFGPPVPSCGAASYVDAQAMNTVRPSK